MTNEQILSEVDGLKRRGTFWRILALIQIPVTFFAVFLFLKGFMGGDTIIRVQEEKIPGEYPVSEVPDDEFINVATKVSNLLVTYQPATVREQYQEARNFIADSALEKFDEGWMDKEMVTAENAHLSQLMLLDEDLTRILREGKDYVDVRLGGPRQRRAGEDIIGSDYLVVTLRLISGPPAEGNNYGIMVTQINIESKPLVVIQEENSRIDKSNEKDKDKKKKPRRRRGKNSEKESK